MKKGKTALVLSGGGVRGFAHLGVLKALNEFDIHPDLLSGTSAGAIAAVLYADGHTPDEAINFFKSKELLRYIQIVIPRTGLVKMTGMVKLLKKYVRAHTFEALQKPVYIAASNLNSGQVEYFSSGELFKPLIASASIPVFFSPVKINNNYYVDGGVLDNFPVKPIENLADTIIGVFVNPISYQENFNNVKNIAIRAFQLTINKNVPRKAKRCNIVISPPELHKYGVLEVNKNEEIFEIGYNEAVRVLKNNPWLIKEIKGQ